ncbi:MAG: hypothetical protein ABSB69_05525 [Solirubrobacteraceae bacterium]|jgi:hypothetical protein
MQDHDDRAAGDDRAASSANDDEIARIEFGVDEAVKKDTRAQWLREVAGITAGGAVVAAAAAVVAAAPEALAAAAGITAAGAAVGQVAALAGRRDKKVARGSRTGPDPLRGLAPARLAARHSLTRAANDPTLVFQDGPTV